MGSFLQQIMVIYGDFYYNIWVLYGFNGIYMDKHRRNMVFWWWSIGTPGVVARKSPMLCVLDIDVFSIAYIAHILLPTGPKTVSQTGFSFWGNGPTLWVSFLKLRHQKPWSFLESIYNEFIGRYWNLVLCIEPNSHCKLSLHPWSISMFDFNGLQKTTVLAAICVECGMAFILSQTRFFQPQDDCS